MDIEIGANGSFELPIDAGWNSIIFVYEGEGVYHSEKGSHQVGELNCCVLETSEEKPLKHTMKSINGAKFVLISGKPLK